MSDSLALLTNRPAGTDELTLALDPNDAQRLLEAESKARRAKGALERAEQAAAKAGANQAAADELEVATEEHRLAAEALAALKASIVTFTVHLKAVGPRRVEELMHEHPPTKAQKAAARAAANGNPNAEPDWDEDSFAPALLAEAITLIEFSSDASPIESLSLSQATDLWLSPWPQGDRQQVFNTAVLLNQASSQVGDLGKG